LCPCIELWKNICTLYTMQSSEQKIVLKNVLCEAVGEIKEKIKKKSLINIF